MKKTVKNMKVHEFVKIKAKEGNEYITVYNEMSGEIVRINNLTGTAEINLDHFSIKKIEAINLENNRRFTILPTIPLNYLEKVDRFLII